MMYQPMFIYIYIFPSMLISPILAISMNSWFMIWIMLEFNMMTFIPLIIYFNKFYKNLALKYFIIQTFSSSILILFSNSQLINFFENNYLIYIFINISILIKLGAAPFHSWFISLMMNMNWLNCLILSTWQKIIPMILIMYSFFNKIIYLSIIISCLIGSILSLNHQSLRLILSYSSINHISWMLMNLMISEKSWILYFISYFIINSSIMLIFSQFNINFINQLLKLNNKPLMLILIMNFISISGLPPMFGFLMKWFSLYMMNLNSNYILIFLLIMMSIMTFYFYLRICIYMLIMVKLNFKSNLNYIFFKNYKLKKFIIFNSFIILWYMSIWLF
uniref:NADH-ubiquinone oxidoreductase chain 2 n=1 Tax=Pimpla luctuosa TaxID=495389 RepID=A0A3S5HLQ0_9HYME|nr:NADH dehydrogenase subunit 2 [Pimpla luctuosa]